jgi:ketosteroid isomerase-like protein
MNDSVVDAADVAERLTAAIEANDPDALAKVYAAEASLWHSTDELDLSVSQVQDLACGIAAVADCTITVTGFSSTETGFVQTQINEYRLRSGQTVRFHCAVVVGLDPSGQVVRQEDYLDGTRLGPLLEATRSWEHGRQYQL